MNGKRRCQATVQAVSRHFPNVLLGLVLIPADTRLSAAVPGICQGDLAPFALSCGALSLQPPKFTDSRAGPHGYGSASSMVVACCNAPARWAIDADAASLPRTPTGPIGHAP